MTATFSKMKVILVSISHFLKKLSFEVIINLEKDFQVFGQYFSHLNKTLLLEKSLYGHKLSKKLLGFVTFLEDVEI